MNDVVTSYAEAPNRSVTADRVTFVYLEFLDRQDPTSDRSAR